MFATNRLSSAEREELEALRVQWAELALSTDRAVRPRAERAIIAMYRAAGLPPPDVTWVSNPVTLVVALRPRGGRGRHGELVASLLNRQLHSLVREVIRQGGASLFWEANQEVFSRTSPSWSRHVRELTALTGLWPSALFGLRPHLVPEVDPAWDLALLEFFARRLGRRERKLLAPHMELARTAHWMIPRRTSCWVSDRPTRIERDEEGEFHSEDGPALAYGTGRAICAWHGTRVPEAAILDPESITLSEIERAPRDSACAMIECIGLERFIRKFAAWPRHEDETGRLWVRRMQGQNSPWVWACVEVENGTPEPDGSHRRYFLPVPPMVRTARQAVAWTYGMRAEDYAPQWRT